MQTHLGFSLGILFSDDLNVMAAPEDERAN